jgi:two-component system, OmpR family, sensor histidine kinase QseC
MSIQRYLIVLIISIITLASFFAALHGYRASMAELDKVFDTQLQAIAEVLGSSADVSRNAPLAVSGHYVFQVIEAGQVIASSAGAPTAQLPFGAQPREFGDITFMGERWRTFTLLQGQRRVIVAQPLQQRVESAEYVLYEAIFPLVMTIPIIGLLVLYVIQQSLRPLRVLAEELREKGVNDLAPIRVEGNAEELKPIETTLNRLFDRLSAAFEREQQLSANAAHELRTPISVLTISAHNLAKAYNDGSLTPAVFKELKDNVSRMAHVIEQIIALYRFLPENFTAARVEVNLETILQDVIVNHYADITALSQSVSLEAEPIWLAGDAFALTTLFENLLHNAIKYSGAGAEIRLSASQQADTAMVLVDDAGAGLADEDYQRIFQRFYRAGDQSAGMRGSGLGMSIAQHIIDLHKGSIYCEKSPLGGLRVVVKLPSLKSANKPVKEPSREA